LPTFTYSALDVSGKPRQGTIDAASQDAAIAAVLSEGRYVTEIRESKSGEATRKTQEGEKKKPRATRSDVALFIRRMADLSDAGLPLDRVLQVLAEQSEAQPLSDAAAKSLEQVREGMPVSDALAQHPKLFNTVVTETLRSGEMSGQFPQSATRLAELMEKDVTRRSLVTSALIYPGVLTAVAIAVVVFLLTFVVPRLSEVFDGLGGELPAPTRLLLAITGFLTNNGLAIVIGLVVAFFAYRLWVKTPGGAMVRDTLLMNLPLGGPLIKKGIVSRYSRVLGTLVNGGVPILDALRLAGLASANQVFIRTSDQVLDDVREGRPIAIAMKEAGAFPPVLTHMVAIGEETGDLPKMLTRVSDSLDFEMEQGLRRITSMLEPIIVVVMGAFVAFIILSVMLPIYEAQQLVR
jgi:type IV pilus assembly protein PilC